MDAAFVKSLQAAKYPEDKAALIADAGLNLLSKEVAYIARQCVLFHWFNQSVVEKLLLAFSPNKANARNVYEQIISLPFVEQLPWGAAYQDLTRQGLLRQYASTQPELLKSAANLAFSAYRAFKDTSRYDAEALFCSIISGDTSAGNTLLSLLLERAMSQQDWQQMEGIFRLQEEAEQLIFVQPLPRTESYWMLRSIVDRVRGDLSEALIDYDHALNINPENALAYLNRSVVHAQLGHNEQAQDDHRKALQLDPGLVQIYIARGALAPLQQANDRVASAAKTSQSTAATDAAGLKNRIFQLSEGYISTQMKAQLPTFRTLWERIKSLPLEALGVGFQQGSAPSSGLGFASNQSLLPVISLISWAVLNQSTLTAGTPEKAKEAMAKEAQARGFSRSQSYALANYLLSELLSS